MNELCLFVSDLHGKVNRYEKLFDYIKQEKPGALFIGGDILPSSVLHSFRASENKPDFITDYLAPNFERLHQSLGDEYPRVFIIMGNDDPRIEEETLMAFEKEGLWEYVHGKVASLDQFHVVGYSFVPPTPFILKDWERYDIDQTVQPGCIPPYEGFRTFKADEVAADTTIADDLKVLCHSIRPEKCICLFHSPPYQTSLDRIALDPSIAEQTKTDVFVGSKAIKEFILRNKPYLTLHGHIHESSRLTGSWKETIGDTLSLTAAFEGPNLAVVRFELSNLFNAQRIEL